MKHTTALAALIVAATGLTALPVMAQDTTPVHDRSNREIHRTIIRDSGGPAGGGLLRLVCSENGAEALEIHFVRLSHRLDLTDAQTPLFDALKASALTAQTGFADTCAANLPDRSAAATPDMLERLKAGLAIEEARLSALNEVMPDFEAFYTSLTDDQKSGLMPRMGRGMGKAEGGDRGMRSDRGDRSDRDAPGRTNRAPAPGR